MYAFNSYTKINNHFNFNRKAWEEYGENFNRSDENNFETVHDSESHGDHLVLQNVQMSDAGIYFCIGITNSGDTIEVLHLTVRYYHIDTRLKRLSVSHCNKEEEPVLVRQKYRETDLTWPPLI